MKTIFPLQHVPKTNPPYSLVESYVSLTLLCDQEYIKSGSLSFQKFYKIFL
jgi:hypothetical protein